jgi:hypothetical protein
MVIPPVLAHRFQAVRPLKIRENETGGVWLVVALSEAAARPLRALKLSSPSRSPDARILNHLPPPGDASMPLAIPAEFGQVDGWFYQVSDYFPLGSLDQYLARPGDFSEGSRMALLRQLHGALATLHTTRNGRCIIHGDLKPSNIMVRQAPAGDREYLLADFDAAVLMDTGRPPDRSRRYTPHYAAPEVLGGGPLTPAADYWSLGMLLLECLLGSHPLSGIEPRMLRGILTTSWQPSFQRIEDSHWRSLLGGLLARDPEIRWQDREVRRWLARDPAAISIGLQLTGESACDHPLSVEGSPVYSPMGLAQTVLRHWSAGIMNEGEELPSWLRRELRRNDLAARLESLRTDAALDDDLRLLHFCHDIWPEMPALWRGRALTAENLDAAARGALAGNAFDLEWLRSLWDGRPFDFYARCGHESVEQLGQRLRDTEAAYAAAWDALIGRGAPAEARPETAAVPPLVVRLAFSGELRAEIRRQAQHLLDPVQLLQRASWFLHFGTNLDNLSISQLSVLLHLNRVSLLGEQNLASLDELGGFSPEHLRNRVLVLASQQRLWRNLMARPGAAVTVLRPGETHRPARTVDLRDFLARRMNRAAEFFRNWISGRLRRLLRRQGESGVGSPAVGPDDLWLEMRLVRVTAAPDALDLRDEFYLARISWRGPADSRPRLHLRHCAPWLREPRLITPVLPDQGQTVLVLASDTRVQLVARGPGLRRRSTRPIEIRFGHREPLNESREGLVPPSSLQRPVDGALLAVDGRLMPGETRWLRPESLRLPAGRISRATGAFLPAEGRAFPKPRNPEPWQRRLGAVLFPKPKLKRKRG